MKSLKFIYKKSPGFHNYHIDGALGGINPRGTISINFYSERHSLPDSVEHEINDNNTLGSVLKEDKSKGIIRELETGIIIDHVTAVSLRDWLNKIIKEHPSSNKK